MESRSRTLWMIVGFAALGLCLCAVVVAVAAIVWLEGWPGDWSLGSIGAEETVDRTFEVGESPTLTIDNYAGQVTVRAGEEGEIRVLATKHTRRASNLERIEVRFEERDDGVSIRTGAALSAISSWVRLEITAPAGTRLDLSTGSGSVEVRDLRGGATINSGSGSLTLRDLSGNVDAYSGSGSIDVQGFAGDLDVETGSGGIDVADLEGTLKASSGTGSMEVRRASGQVRLDTGSGSIEYQGSPVGECRFDTSSGHIRLELPASLNADLDLHTSSGTVNVGWPTVKGLVRKNEVRGTIGDGGEVSIYARTGSGGIDLLRR